MKIRKTTYQSALIIFLVIAATVGVSAQYNTAKQIANMTNDDSLKITVAQLSGKAPAYVGGNFQIINDRRLNSPMNALAAKCIYYKFKEFGCDARFTDTIINPLSGKLETAYSVKPGKDPKKLIILAAGFDSNSPASDSISPGANTSASSCAVVIEAARLAKGYTTERTMIFALFDDMNNNGLGALQLLDSLKKQGYDSTIAIFLDNLSYKGENGFLEITSQDTTKSPGILNEFRFVNETLYPGEAPLAAKQSYTPFAWLNTWTGMEEALFARNLDPNQPYLFSKEDTYDHLELPFYLKNVRTAIASCILLANPFTVGVGDARPSTGLTATNPCGGNLRITSENALGSLKIFDIYGKEVYLGFEVGPEAIINANCFSPGVYFIQSGCGEAKFIKM